MRSEKKKKKEIYLQSITHCCFASSGAKKHISDKGKAERRLCGAAAALARCFYVRDNFNPSWSQQPSLGAQNLIKLAGKQP